VGLRQARDGARLVDPSLCDEVRSAAGAGGFARPVKLFPEAKKNPEKSVLFGVLNLL